MRNDVAGVILAGGEGSRIGGAKPLIELAGERLIDRALRQAGEWSNCVAVAVREPAQVEPIDAPLLADDPAIAGPLAGLAAALHFAAAVERAFLLTIPTDMPFLPRNLIDRLFAHVGDGCALASSGGYLHPVCGLWRTSARERIAEYLASERRSLRGFAALIGFVAIDWPTAPFDPFFNINTADDLFEAERIVDS
jgi:molybdopterin-guanine dinucleotide biosynthesis protein A